MVYATVLSVLEFSLLRLSPRVRYTYSNTVNRMLDVKNRQATVPTVDLKNGTVCELLNNWSGRPGSMQDCASFLEKRSRVRGPGTSFFGFLPAAMLMISAISLYVYEDGRVVPCQVAAQRCLHPRHWRCQPCGAMSNLEVHQDFRSPSGEDSEQNLITLCTACHATAHHGLVGS